MRRTRTLRTDIPTDVWERFAAEAAAKDIPIGRHLRNLLVARDRRRQDTDASPSIGSNQKGK